MLIEFLLALTLAHGHMDFENKKFKECQEMVLVEPGNKVEYDVCLKDWERIYELYYSKDCNKEHSIIIYRGKKDRYKILIPFIDGLTVSCEKV